jgi:NAD(P)H-quinone oxidoreductase subunit 5
MTPSDLSLSSLALPPWIAAVVPGAFAVGAVAVALDRGDPARGWWTARGAAIAAALAAAAAAADVGGLGPATLAQAVLLGLVTLLGVVLTRFSASYLAGEPGERRFAGWLLSTLAGASFVLVTDDLLQLCLGWLATSLSLQRLLTFYPDRPGALIAAREKFLVSRAADLCMTIAAVLLGTGLGTLSLGGIGEVAAAGELPATARVAMAFVAVAALLKCAQLPVQRWLLGIMEAPTPVSALLHAGVVNLGGFVLIRLGPALVQAPVAQWLLVVFGGTTAAFAALAVGAQSSIKRTLAWSTCAQMGFLMVQCGLGAFEMALLHLVAHSAYKAHAFLAAGSSVARNAALAGLPPRATVPTPGRLLFSAVTGLALVAAAFGLVMPHGFGDPAAVVGGLVVAIALAALFANGDPAAGGGVRRGAAALLMLGTWVLLHDLLRASMGLPTHSGASWWLALGALLAMAPLPLLRSLQWLRPQHPWVPALRVFCQRGAFVGPWFTAVALRTWRVPPLDHSSARSPDLSSALRLRGDS